MIILFILIALSLYIGIIVFTLRITIRNGYKWLGIIALCLISILFWFIPAMFTLDGLFFNKKNAIEVLSENGIELNSDFEFESKSIKGIIDYILEFNLNISEGDKKQIIQQLENSEFRDLTRNCESCDLYSKIPKYLKSDTILQVVYETDKMWNMQRLHVLQNRYVRTSDFIQIAKNANKIYVERHE